MEIIYNKWIRDHIPEIVERDNKTCKVRVMDDIKNKKVSNNGAFNKRLFLECVEKNDVQ